MTTGDDFGTEVLPTGQGQAQRNPAGAELHRTAQFSEEGDDPFAQQQAQDGAHFQEAPQGEKPLEQRVREGVASFNETMASGEKSPTKLLEEYKKLLLLKQEAQRDNNADVMKDLSEQLSTAKEELITTLLGKHGDRRDADGGEILQAHIEENPLTELAEELGNLEVVQKLGITPTATYAEIVSQVKEKIAQLSPEQRPKIVEDIQEFGQQLKEAAAYLALKPKYLEDEHTRKVLKDLYNAGDTIAKIGGETKGEDPLFSEDFIASVDSQFREGRSAEQQKTDLTKRGELTIFILTGKDGKTIQTDPLVSYFLKRKALTDDSTGETRLETDEEYYGRILRNEDKRLDRLQESLTRSVADGQAARKIRDEITSYAYDALSAASREKILGEALSPEYKKQAVQQGEDVIEDTFGEDGVRLLKEDVADIINGLEGKLGHKPSPEDLAKALAELVGKYKKLGEDESIAGKHILNKLYDKSIQESLVCISSDYVLAPIILEQFKKFGINAQFGAETILEGDAGHSYLVMVIKQGDEAKVYKIDPTSEGKALEEMSGDEAIRLKKKYSVDEQVVREALLEKNEKVIVEDTEVTEKDETTGEDRQVIRKVARKVKTEPTPEEIQAEIQRRKNPDTVYKQLEAAMVYNLRLSATPPETTNPEAIKKWQEAQKQFVDKAYDLDPSNPLIIVEKARQAQASITVLEASIQEKEAKISEKHGAIDKKLALNAEDGEALLEQQQLGEEKKKLSEEKARLTQETADKNRLLEYAQQFLPQGQIDTLLARNNVEIRRVDGAAPALAGVTEADVRDIIDKYIGPTGLKEKDEAIEVLDEIFTVDATTAHAAIPATAYEPVILAVAVGDAMLPMGQSLNDFGIRLGSLRDEKNRATRFAQALQTEWERSHPNIPMSAAQQQVITEAKNRAATLEVIISGLTDLSYKQQARDLQQKKNRYNGYITHVPPQNQLGAALTPDDIAMLHNEITYIDKELAGLLAKGYPPPGADVTPAQVREAINGAAIQTPRDALQTAYDKGENLGLFLSRDQLEEFQQQLRNARRHAGRGAGADAEIDRIIDQMDADIILGAIKDNTDARDFNVEEELQTFQTLMGKIEERGVEVVDLVNQQSYREPMFEIVGRFKKYVDKFKEKNKGTADPVILAQIKKLERQYTDLEAENWARPWLWEANRIIGTNFSQNSAQVEEYQKRVKNDRLFILMNIEHVGLAMRIRAQVAEKYIRQGKRMTPDIGKQIDDEAEARLKQEVAFLVRANPHDDINSHDLDIKRASGIAKIIDGNLYLTGKRGGRTRLPSSYEQYSKQSQSVAQQAFDPFGQLQLLEGLPHIGYTLLRKVGLEKMKRLYYMGDWVTYGTNREAAIIAMNARGLYDFDLYMRLRHQFESESHMKAVVHSIDHDRKFEEARVRDTVISAGHRNTAQIEEQVDIKMEEWDKGWLKIFQEKSRSGNSFFGDDVGQIDPATGRPITNTQKLKELIHAVHTGNLEHVLEDHGHKQVFYKADILKKLGTYEPTTFAQIHLWESKALEDILTNGGIRTREDGIKIFEDLDANLGRLQELDYYKAKKELTATPGSPGYRAYVSASDSTTVRAAAFSRENPETSGLLTPNELDMYIQLREYMSAHAEEYAKADVINGKAARFNRNVVTETDMFWELYRNSTAGNKIDKVPGTGPADDVESMIGNNSMANATGRIIQGYNFSQALGKVFGSPQSYEALTKMHGTAGWLDRTEEEEFIGLLEEGRLKLFRYSPLGISDENMDKMRSKGAEIQAPFTSLVANYLHLPEGEIRLGDLGLSWRTINIHLENHQKIIDAIEKVNDITRLHIVPVSEARKMLGKKGLRMNPTDMENEIRDLVSKGVITPADAKRMEQALQIIWILRGLPWLQIIAAAMLMTFVKELQGILEGK